MLHTRIIPVLTLKDGRLIKTIKFDDYNDVGHPVTQARFYDSQDVDELILLDITATQENRHIDIENIEAFANEASMPLAIGGGIKTIADINKLLNVGADKVVINSYAVENPSFITEAANHFGSQCIVISIDVKKINGQYKVATCGGAKITDLDPVEWAMLAVEKGCGEIVINAIDRDGTAEGYDLALTKNVSDAVTVPVIALGGVGTLEDLVDGLVEGHANALACSTIFHFTDNKPVKANAYVKMASEYNATLIEKNICLRAV